MQFTNNFKSFSTPLFVFILVIASLLMGNCKKESWPPDVQAVSEDSPALTPEEALQTFYLPPGYDIELVASEPLVVDPVAMDFDADGRLWVVEMRSYMPTVDGQGEKNPIGKIAVLEDTTGDGRMDQRTTYMDSLVLPRTVKVLDHGVLVGAPPHLWMTQDTTGDLRTDIKRVVRDDFGDPSVNPESNPNSLIWGIDNWIHTTHYEGRFRLEDDKLHYDKTLSLGQWGISMDNYGRIYRNNNSNPLSVDYIPSHYYGDNENLTNKKGIYEPIPKTKTVWPIRPTTGINRGYRKHMLREDSTLTRYTSASALAVYRGDRLPDELRNDVFVPEPAGNLVQRLVIKNKKDGSLVGSNPYEDIQADFLTSTDERFRPVNIYSGPDGTLYITDMYKGIIQHETFLTNYLQTEIKKRGLEKPQGLGRIYRIVHNSQKPSEKPQLSSKSPEELVTYLEHPNGWWRDTAQQLLVERQSSSVVPPLKKMVRDGEKDYTRLHALWTLDGLNSVDNATLDTALADPSPHIRATAIRIAEPTFTQPDQPHREKVMDLMDDSTYIVRRQLAASIGKFPSKKRMEALLKMTERYGDDPIIVSLAISALPQQEFAFLQQLLDQSEEQSERSTPVEELTKVILRSGSQKHINILLKWVGDKNRPAWQRKSILAGVEEIVPEPSTRGNLFKLNQKPTVLLAAANSTSDQLSDRIASVAKGFNWPGKPNAEPPVKPLTSEEKKRFALGKKLYISTCSSCHQQNGKGLKGMAPPLVNSKWVLGNPSHLIRILLDGKEGEMSMPPIGSSYSDEEIAAITTYIRRAWNHEVSPVSPSLVLEVRGASTGRDRPWTEEELNKHRH